MADPSHLRSQDWRAILQLVGECRELGDDRVVWRRHLLQRLSGLVGADLGFCGEMAGVKAEKQVDLGFADWGIENGFSREAQVEVYCRVARDPSIYGVMCTYLRRMAQEDGVCHSRREIVGNHEWYNSTSYQLVHQPRDVDHVMWCFRSIPGRTDEFSGLNLERAEGEAEFSMRQHSIVRETHAALTPLIGGPLARFSDPSPLSLPPRVRQVLDCLLEGDGAKQIASRLKLDESTVKQDARLIFKHFGVKNRAGLQSRWIRRHWGGLT